MSYESDREETLASLIELCDAAIREDDIFYSTDAQEAETRSWERAIRERVFSEILDDEDSFHQASPRTLSLDDEIAAILGEAPTLDDTRVPKKPLGSGAVYLEPQGRRFDSADRGLKRLHLPAVRLARLGGGRKDILAAVPGTRAQYALAGWLLVASGLFAFASMAAAARIAFEATPGLSIAMGALWGILVVGIERALIVAIPQGSRKRLALSFIPRLVFVTLMSAAMAVPLVQTIYEPEILAQFSSSQEARIDSQAAELQGRIDRQNELLSSNYVEEDAAVVAAKYRLARLESEISDARALLACETSGTCGSKAPGFGPRAAHYAKRIDDLERQRASERGQLDAARESAQRNQEAAAPEAYALREKLLGELKTVTTVEASTSPGLIERQRILAEGFPGASSPEFLIFLLGLIPVMPVLYRYSTLASGGTVQDRLIQSEECHFASLQERRMEIEHEIRELELLHVRKQFQEDTQFAHEAQSILRSNRHKLIHDLARDDLDQAEEDEVIKDFFAVLQRIREIDFIRGLAWSQASPPVEPSNANPMSNVRDIRTAIRRGTAGLRHERDHG